MAVINQRHQVARIHHQALARIHHQALHVREIVHRILRIVAVVLHIREVHAQAARILRVDIREAIQVVVIQAVVTRVAVIQAVAHMDVDNNNGNNRI